MFEPTPQLIEFNDSSSYVSITSCSKDRSADADALLPVAVPSISSTTTLVSAIEGDLDDELDINNSMQTTTYCHGCERKHSSPHMHTIFAPSLPVLMAHFPNRVAQFSRFSSRRVILCCKWFKPNHPQCIRRAHLANLLARHDPLAFDDTIHPMLPPPLPAPTERNSDAPRKRARVEVNPEPTPTPQPQPVVVAHQPPTVINFQDLQSIDFMLARRRVAHAHLQHAVQHLRHTLATLSVVTERTLEASNLHNK